MAKTGWLLLWLAIAAGLVLRASSRPDSRGVILDHLEFGRRLVHGEDVYGPWRSDPDAPVRPLHAPYPPSFGLLVAPFHAIDAAAGRRAARAAWAVLQVACLLTTALLLRRRTRASTSPPSAPHDLRPWHCLWFGTFLLSLRFLLRDTHGGGGNVVNLALCLLAFDASERDRPRLAGLWLGLSLATKPTQLWLLPVFFLLDRRRTVGWTLVTGAVAALLTLALQHFDLAPWQRWIEGSWRLATQADAFAVPALDFPPFEWMNQALRCGLARWLGEVPPDLAARVTLAPPTGLGLAPMVVAQISRAASLGLLGGLLWTAWRTRHVARARLWVVAGALVLSVLLSPLSWKAHHMALVPALFLLLRTAVQRRARGPWLWLAAWAICCLPGKELIGDAADEWCNSLYLVTGWDVVLCLLCLHHARSAAAPDHDAAAIG